MKDHGASMPGISGDTGRIGKPLTPAARRILFDRDINNQIEAELRHICRIDLAHVLMLAEQEIIEAAPARQLLTSIQSLEREKFEPLRSLPATRGLFLLYEKYLIDTQGPGVGGLLQTGRSRNDLNATILRLRLRQPYVDLLTAILRLQAVLMRSAERYSETVMPAYTHGQPAEPISYGHYLAGIAEAIRRDLDYLLDAGRFMDICPLGAGAVAGTGLPINTARTAELLGFSSPARNSIDAVASRDVVLRLLAAMSIFGATLSRSATDLLQWLTVEFQFLSLPDELVGSSSAMPQKRNPFLLEHVQGRTASALGAFTSAIAATRNAPFTNAITVGTESVRPLWGALRDMTDATVLLRLVIAGARPCEERMFRRATEGFINATAAAVRMVEQKGLDFRSAHHLVGRAVTEAQDRNLASLEELAAAGPDVLGISLEGMDPASCVRRARYGGGPAPESLKAALVGLKEGWLQQRRSIRQRVAQWTTAQGNLTECVQRFVEERAVTGRVGLRQRKTAH